MDNATAKQILSAYRPNGEDARDPVFREALAQCENDPAMKAWFADQRAFDERIASALSNIPTPESGKRTILALAQTEVSPTTTQQRVTFWQRRSSWLALAAALAIVGMTARLIPTTAPTITASTNDESLSNMASRAMPLEFKHSETSRILDWLKERGADVPNQLASKIIFSPAAGCRIFKTPQGGAISLICLEVEQQLVHVFIYDSVAAEHYQGPLDNWWREDGYNLITTARSGQLVAFATRADRDAVAHLL